MNFYGYPIERKNSGINQPFFPKKGYVKPKYKGKYPYKYKHHYPPYPPTHPYYHDHLGPNIVYSPDYVNYNTTSNPYEQCQANCYNMYANNPQMYTNCINQCYYPRY